MNAYLMVLLATLQGVLALAAIGVAPWRELLRVPVRVHLLLGSTVVLAALLGFAGAGWSILGLSTATLLLGAPLALLAGTAAQLAVALSAGVGPAAALAAAWVEVSIPVTVTVLALRAVTRWGPDHLFAYVLGVGFFGAILARVAALIGFVALSGRPLPIELVALLAFAEGFINGMLVTVLAVHKPHWMRTLDERRYIDRGPH